MSRPKRRDARDPRALAYEVLLDVEKHGAFADARLGNALDRADLVPEDRGLATLLVYGTLARQLTLDHTLAEFAGRPLAKVDPKVLTIARLGLFQIAFLDRVPDYAAVDTSVVLAKRVAVRASGFVNALLRRACREGLVAAPGDERRRSIELSHPHWLVDLWTSELGEAEADALMRANNEAQPNVLRALVDRDEAIQELAKQGVSAVPARFAPDGLTTPVATTVRGIAIAQGEGSQLVTMMVDAKPGERILDACAAPGGKSAYLAKLVGPEGSVTAVDPANGAAERVERVLRTAGVENVEVVNDSIESLAFDRPFDRVLVDAPCSGLGTLREHPEIRWRRSLEDIADLAKRQSAILDAAAKHVRPGGRLVYSTCTIAEAENDRVVDAFLARAPELRPVRGDDLPAYLRPVLDDAGRMRTYPHRHDMAGYFAAPFTRAH